MDNTRGRYAIQELGLKDNVRVVAFDSNVVSIGMLETGEVDTLIVQNSYAMGYLGVETAYKLINGYSIKDTIYTDTIAVDKEICMMKNVREDSLLSKKVTKIKSRFRAKV